MDNKITIVDYTTTYKTAFKAINQEWIERYFVMEASDNKLLDNPDGEIIAKGGYIAIALLNNKAVGACALLPSHLANFDYELTKMGVLPEAQGYGAGKLLCQAMITKARELNASNLFIESNTVLGPAINLYKKWGLKKLN